MKKFTLTLLALLYLAVTCGVSVNLHYCMGKFREVQIGHAQGDQCGTCGMAVKNTGCCQDHAQWLKVDDNHQLPSLHSPGTIAEAIIQPLPGYIHAPIGQETFAKLSSHAPPGLPPAVDFNILYCVFRI